MSWDDDDLPAGYPDVWGAVAERAHWYQLKLGAFRDVPRECPPLRVVRDVAPEIRRTPENVRRRKAEESARHYAKARQDPAWRERRNAYYRKWQAQRKAAR